MIDKSGKTEAPRQAMQPSLPTRLSCDKVVEDIDKWANSAGLQRPK